MDRLGLPFYTILPYSTISFDFKLVGDLPKRCFLRSELREVDDSATQWIRSRIYKEQGPTSQSPHLTGRGHKKTLPDMVVKNQVLLGQTGRREGLTGSVYS